VAVARDPRDRGGLAEVELDVVAVADPARRDGHVAEVTRLVVSALDHSDVLLVTSRELRRGRDAAENCLVNSRSGWSPPTAQR
jgi:hypothetical protein